MLRLWDYWPEPCIRASDSFDKLGRSIVTHLPACRDRRYEYKGLNKVWKGKSDEAKVSRADATS